MSITSMITNSGVTGTIKSLVQTQNAVGELVQTWTDVYSNVPMRIVLNRGVRGADTKDITYNMNYYTIYIANSYTILDSYRLVCAGETYKIIRAGQDSSKNHYELQCDLIND